MNFRIVPRTLAFRAIEAAPDRPELLPASTSDVAKLECERARAHGIGLRALEDQQWLRTHPTPARVEMSQFNVIDGWRGAAVGCARLVGATLPVKLKQTTYNPDGSVKEIIVHDSWRKIADEQRRAKLRKQIAARIARPMESVRVIEPRQPQPVPDAIADFERRERKAAVEEKSANLNPAKASAEIVQLARWEKANEESFKREALLKTLDMEVKRKIAEIECILRDKARFAETVRELRDRFPGSK